MPTFFSRSPQYSIILQDNSLVVWKEINMNRLPEKESTTAEKEVEILSLMDHTNIITYYNHFIDSGNLYIEMEYANGES